MKKVDRKRLLALAKQVLCARRNRNVKAEQTAYDKINQKCHDLGILHEIDAGVVIEQAISHLKRTSIAAPMNGIV